MIENGKIYLCVIVVLWVKQGLRWLTSREQAY